MIILGSASPRRKMLLESAGVNVQVEAADIDERCLDGESAVLYVERMAREKARAVSKGHEGEPDFVVSADTIVVHGGKILGKPATREVAFEMLSELSGQVHSVFTAVCIVDTKRGISRHFVVETQVHFAGISAARLWHYIDTGEPMDKAGAYGIQGRAAGFVERIEGSYTNVVGLPLCETIEVLEEMGAI
ncbi:MAG: septum formation inhibitor Maf [Proteobacteria bacterium]|nr:septum formation inhibitor Maf [Pseudomonadota bacterium]